MLETHSAQVPVAMQRCPTCGAQQPLSEVCRRCRCDLSLLVPLPELAGQHYRCALAALRGDRPADALQSARRAHELDPTPGNRRLLAVCALLSGEWRLALPLARAALAEEPA